MDKKTRKKFDALVSHDSKTAQNMRKRKKNRQMFRLLGVIAIDIIIAMEEKGLSIEELAEQLDISVEDVKSLRKGKFDFSFSLGLKLEKILGIVIFNSTELKP